MTTTARPRRLSSGRVTWRVQFRVNGKVTSESFADDRAATAFARLVDRVGGEAAMKARDARDRPERTAPTLAEWTARYLDASTGHLSGVTPGTRRGYEVIAERSFLPTLGELPLDVITKQEVAKWVHWLEKQESQHRPGQPIAAKTIRNYHSVLSAILSAAVEERLIPYNPAKGIKLTRGMRDEPTFLTVAEFDRLREAMPAYYRPLATWLVWTGMRWGEATALTWADINFDSYPMTARVTKAWKKGPTRVPVLGVPKTPKSVRTVVVPTWLVEQLGEPGRPDGLIFHGMKSGEFLWWQRFYKTAWSPAIVKADLGKRPRIHDLRHTHASWLIADGVPALTIQYRLGHESITTTFDLYGHLMPDAQRAVIASLDSRYVAPPPQALPLEPPESSLDDEEPPPSRS